MSTVWLIRHGTTEANEKHLYCGSTDLPLSDAGRAALRELHYEPMDADYVTSGLRRTEETLQLLFGSRPFRSDPAFREIDFGRFEMHSYDELKDDPAYCAWLTGDNERNVPPGGESGEQMCRRVLPAFEALLQSGRDTVLVTHGGVIAAIMEARYPEEGKNRYQWQPLTGHGYRIDENGWNSVP